MNDVPLDEGDAGSVRYGLTASAPAPSADEVETAASAIELVIMWGDHVLGVEHLSPIRSFYVGEPGDRARSTTECTIDPELLGRERVPVVLAVGDTAAVVIPDGATGDVRDASGRHGLASIIASGRALPCAELPGAHQYPLSAGATARVAHRGFTYVVRPVRAGRAVGKSAPPFDAKRSAWTLLSFSIHGLFLLAAYFMPPAGSALSMDRLGEDARRLRYLLQPPESHDEPQPDWLERAESEDPSGGQGERHAGTDGALGSERSKQTKQRFGIAAPRDNEDPQLSRDQAIATARAAGILGVLSTATAAWNRPSSPYATAEIGYDPVHALGLLTGEQVGESFGLGGLGMRGTGRGGGGSGEGTVGIGNVGTVGHGGGGGSDSGFGRSLGGVRAREGRVPQLRSGDADVRGSLSKEVIRRVIQRHLNEVRHCYEQELSARPDLSGRVQVRFVISPSGVVQLATVEKSTLAAERAEHCIAQAVRRWTFPAPDGGGVVIVAYPFLLQTAGD